MNLSEFGATVWRHKLLVLLVLLVTGGAATVGLWAAPRTYTATATVAAVEDPANPVGVEDPDSLRGTIAELANARDVVDDVRSQLSVERSTEELRREITGQWVEGTILVRVTVQDEDPQIAAEIANLVADALPYYDPTSGSFLVTVSNPAVAPRTFSSPDLLLGAGIAGVLGLVLAIGAALLRDRRTATVADQREAEAAAGVPVLAKVARPRDSTSLPSLYPGTAAAGAFHRLRIALEAEASAESVDLLVVAGVTQDDASVWLGANLAVSLAVAGRQVLLVDGRLGTQHGRPIATAPGTAGLYDVLTGADLSDGLSEGPVEGLRVLPAGEWGGEPTERLLETRFAAVMREATRRFDVVVVLAPALDVCDDARVMAAGGSMVLTVPSGAVSPEQLHRAAERVRSVGVRLLGTVLLTKQVAWTVRSARASRAAA
ncbi:Wzz/FepE/Etk N-terminal domain-containing protein [Nocardioides sp. W7]|uniref:Wzz/FepE/Etk N-terminal domain-containing protein n=1 Tax=Nocardioides sp. W7 TaxID=2931390 RepID=UPI001FD4F162|nr:Wzz/FepE/Etk N-terminal domain-containing protein [Nocardioides sp. W7]